MNRSRWFPLLGWLGAAALACGAGACGGNSPGAAAPGDARGGAGDAGGAEMGSGPDGQPADAAPGDQNDGGAADGGAKAPDSGDTGGTGDAAASDAVASGDGSTDAAASPIAISPASGDFGGVLVGVTSATPVVFVVTNGSGSAIAPRAVLSSPEFLFGENGCAMPIPARGMCVVEVFFRPTSLGFKTAVVTLAAGGAVTSGGLFGTGLPHDVLIFTPARYDFGPIPVGARISVSIEVMNPSGGAPLSDIVVVVNGQDFALGPRGSGCGDVLPAGARCGIDVVFAPTAMAVRTGVLSVRDGSGAGGAVMLLGTGN